MDRPTEFDLAQSWACEEGQRFRFKPNPGARGGFWQKQVVGSWQNENEVLVRASIIDFLRHMQQDGVSVRITTRLVNDILTLAQTLRLYRGLLREQRP